MDQNTTQRVRYYKGQFLRASDFNDEQAYHIAMRRRHNIAHHTWGIVRGLELHLQDDRQFFIQPGIAVDGYGRELILPERRQLSTQVFDERGSDRLDVYLAYGLSETLDDERTGPLCDDDTFRSNRMGELPTVHLRRAAPEADRRQPPGTPEGDWGFSPASPSPDDPSQPWLVFLGQITRNRADSTYNVNLSSRPYAGLVGETMVTPARTARLELGTQSAAEPTRRKMAVNLNADEPSKPAQLEITAAAEDKNGSTSQEVTLRGRTEVHGDVSVVGGSLSFQQVDENDVPPTPTQPWRIYRTRIQENGKAQNQLRIEMQRGNPYSIVFGAWSAEEKRFMPCLTITNNCEVIVHGKLIVDRIVDSSGQPLPPPEPVFSSQAQDQLRTMYTTGVSGSAVHADLPDLVRLYSRWAGKAIAGRSLRYGTAYTARIPATDNRDFAQELSQRNVEEIASALMEIDSARAQALRDALNNALEG